MFGGFKALWFGPRCSLLHAIPKPGDLNEYGKVAKFQKWVCVSFFPKFALEAQNCLSPQCLRPIAAPFRFQH